MRKSHQQYSKIEMKFDYEWRYVQFHDTDIQSRIHSSIVALKGKIFLFGGNISKTDQYFNDIFEYEPAAGVWHSLETSGEKPAPRCKSTLRQHDNKIYLYGGLNNAQTFNDIYIFDPQNSTWIQEKPMEYSTASQTKQPILTVQLFYPYLIIIYNGIDSISTPIIWAYSFRSKEWRSIEIDYDGWLWTNNFSQCMVGHYIYIFGRTSIQEASFLTEFDCSKLIKSDSYDDIKIIEYELSGWKDVLGCQSQWVCVKGYDDRIIIAYYIEGSLHRNKLITINMQAKSYNIKNIYGNLRYFHSCRSVMSGSCLVTVGEFLRDKTQVNGHNQSMFYMNITRNYLPPYKYTKLKIHDLQAKNTETTVVVINGIRFQMDRGLLNRYSYFQNLLKFSQPSQNQYEISIMNVKETYLREMMSFINGVQLKSVDKKNKKEEFQRLVNLAYLADYFCIQSMQYWIQDYIYCVSQHQGNIETIVLANMTGLSSFEQYCSTQFVKCLHKPKQIHQILKGTPNEILNKRLNLNRFDLEHKCINNSTRILGAKFSIPQKNFQSNQLSSTLSTNFKAMMQQGRSS